jgi:hypothetical protein
MVVTVTESEATRSNLFLKTATWFLCEGIEALNNEKISMTTLGGCCRVLIRRRLMMNMVEDCAASEVNLQKRFIVICEC